MNKIYRLKFSKRLNALVAVSELTRGCDHSTEKGSEKPARMKVRHLALKPLSAMLLSLGVTSIPQSVLASGLQGMDVVHGTATMQVDGNKTIIRNSVDAIINWKQFNIDQNEMVQFLQENNNSAVFNRVTSNQISQLKGILDSNGQVFLINPNGVAIGKNAIINTNGFTASTLDISNENIKARNFTFEQTKDKALAEIVNHGLITVGKDGSVNLIGGKVKNEGVISVNGGSISLLAGQKITISDIANPTITYSIAAPENEAVNLGDIFAKGGNINVRAANIRNKGKLSADSVSKDKSGNIILSAKEGEAEIGGVISAQNQQAKGGKLMITGDKVTLKTGAVIDLSGKEGGETYLGGDERGEGKNGIQLAKKTSLEKGSTINVSGKEKGGRAIVWGDIALIDGNINAQGKDIAKTGGFVETSGHHLSIDDNAIVKTKEWLLDPDTVTIEAPSDSRQNTRVEDELPGGTGDADTPKTNGEAITTLTNTTISNFLKNAKVINITASKKITVNSSIDIGNNSHLILWSKGRGNQGVQINEDITSSGGNLTINSDGQIDIHKNITLGMGFLNITSGGSVAFEGKSNNRNRTASGAQITAQGTIKLTGENTTFRLNNLSLNGTGKGLNIISTVGNLSHKLDGEINVSGNVTINQTSNYKGGFWKTSYDSYWNVTSFNLKEESTFTFIKSANFPNRGDLSYRPPAGVVFQSNKNNTGFNVGKNATVNFTLKPNEGYSTKYNYNPIRFKSNISLTGGGEVKFNLLSNLSGGGVDMNMSLINVSGGSRLIFNSSIRGRDAFKINRDLTINATCSTFRLEQNNDSFHNSFAHNAIKTSHNITILGGEVALGGNGSSSDISGNINISKGANVTIQADNYVSGGKKLTLGSISAQGNLSLVGTSVDIKGSLDIEEDAIFKGETRDNLNITGTFTNNGTADINIKQGVVNLRGDITNNGSLNITTNAQKNQKTIITGNITNKKGDLNITDNKANAEIQIGGNISQKEGNLTISSDKVNITKQITIKAGVNGEDSSSSAENNANLTITTKELKLVEGLNISGFNKAEITAKGNNGLIIGETSDDSNANAKKVTFNKVKDSKISAEGHGVTLNSKVETSSGDSSTENGSDGNNIGLTISAKDVTVNSNITSHKTVNISASEGGITTKAGTTINATTGSVEVTAKTGDISGTISGNTVNVTATNSLITQSSSKIEAKTGEANVTSATGTIGGTISGNTVSVSATDSLTTQSGSKIEATRGAATLTATKGTLTTAADSSISAASGTLTINAKDAKLNGTASGDHTVVNATNASGSGSVTAKTSSSVNITGDLNTVNGLNIISKDGRNTVRLRGKEIEVKYIQPGVASVEEVIEAKRALEKVKDLSDEERETLAKLGVSAVRFVEPNNAITVNTQNEFTTRPSSQVTISEGKACFSSGNGAAVCTNVADDGQP
ncbi:filamentous hemagglutinin N-terminal domain-containing protein [Haemophilus influenzae]|uniref:two-partner secretion domain-containing protein n=1 Tax=Haemophilus influenzae TaxID=727 RepID=UPI0035BC678E